MARRLLVAAGAVDELPEGDGLRERWGRDVLHCPYCHGYEVAGQAVGVLASGPLAMHQLLLFRQLTDDVVLFLDDRFEPSEKEREQLDALRVRVVPGPVSGVDVSQDRLTGVRLVSGEVVARQALTVQTRVVARSEVLASLGVRTTTLEMAGTDMGEYVATDPTGLTEAPGVWAAGNLTDPTAQVGASAAAGVRAGAVINMDLVTEDTARAVAAHRTG